MKKKLIFIALLLLIAFSLLSFGPSFKKETIGSQPILPTTQNSISYKGEEGKDALALLKQKYSTVQDTSGLVIAIGGRKAESARNEYWAFYVNGKMAQVGPKDFKTKNSDLIEWKIDKF